MADSSFAITAGSGTNIDTRTESTNSNHRQVVVIGADATNAAIATVANAAPASTDYGLVVRPIGQLADDAAFTPATTPVLPIGAEADDTTPDSVDEGDIGALRMSLRRELYTQIRDAAGNERGANVNASNAVLTAQTGALPTGTNNIGTVDGSNVEGDVAHDGVDSGNPIKIGGIALGSQQGAVAASDRTNQAFDRHGNAYTRSGHQAPSGSVWTQIHVPSANTVATKSQGAGGAGVRNVVTMITAVIVATATAPTAVNVTVNLIDGATGGTTYLWRSTLSLPGTAGETRGIALSGLWLPGSTNTATTLEFSAAGGANTIESVSMSGVLITE